MLFSLSATLISIGFSNLMAASPSFAGGWKNDVFLSFRGEDTRNTFTSHLYHALCRHGIDTFIDDKLQRGEEITPSLLQEIEGSRISLVVFSKDYASSTFCLDELTEILKCKISKGQKVLPIFYHVDPSEVRKQGGGFGEAFAQHEARFAGNISKLQRWRIALANAANLTGWHLNNSLINEAEFIQGIVKRVLNILNPTYLHVAEHPVGLESRIQDLEMMLSIETNDVCMIGMYGLGGIGKTTLAKAVYNKIVGEFEASCFLKNVRETSDKLGVGQLQENLLYEIFGDKIELMGNCDRGIIMIKKKLCSKKLLIVIDDVSDVHQLEKLAGATDWFGAGSRIIITTTDEHVLVAHGVEKRYMVKDLSHEDALELFSWKAFKETQPREDFVDLSHRMVRYADGHPLALEVLGSFLCGRTIPQWESELDRLKRGPKRQIYDILKRSYDCLDHDDEKAIFLDIACFFKSMTIDNVMMILDACDFNPVIGIQVLIERSLILIDEGGMLRMHDLIQSMGMQVAKQQSPVPGGRRLCFHFHDDIVRELTENTGVSEIEGIKIDVPNSEALYLKAEVFAKLKRLRILIVCNAHIAGHLENLPNLRLLELSGCSLELFSPEFHPSKLVSLNMRNTNIRQFGGGFKDYMNLKRVHFWNCELLTEIPDLSTIPNLVQLDFDGCENLVKIHSSVGYLERLVHLNISRSSNLRSFPSSVSLTSLETLDLHGCSKLENFPNVSVTMKNLRYIYLGGTGIKDLPSSIENLVGLEFLNLSYCRNLACIPSTIVKLSQLYHLDVRGCSKLVNFAEDEGIESGSNSIMYLEPDILPTSYQSSCSDVDYNHSLINLVSVGGCHSPKVDLPMSSNWCSSLNFLNLSGQNFVSLPSWIYRLTTLRILLLQDCQQLQEILELPPSLTLLSAWNCKSLEGCLQLTRVLFNRNMSRSFSFEFINCHKLAENQGKAFMRSLSSSLEITLENEGFFKDTKIDVVLPGSDIPKWLSYYSEEGYLSFKVPSCLCKKLIGLAFFIILRPQVIFLSTEIMINGQEDNICCISKFYSKVTMKSDHLGFYYFPCLAIKDYQSLLQYEQSQFEVSIKMFTRNKNDEFIYMKTGLKKWGVFLVCTQDENVSDLRLIHKDIDASVETSSNDDEPMCKRKRTMNCNIMNAEA